MRSCLLALGVSLLGTASIRKDDCPRDPVRLAPFHVEFGWETTVAVPHAYWLFKCGKLLETASCGGEHMRALYWFSPRHLNETCQRGAGWRGVHGKYANAITWQEVFAGAPLKQWDPAPHRRHYREQKLAWQPQPTSIYIINKYHARHHANSAPTSFFSIDMLEKILGRIKEACPHTGVVYYRNWEFTGKLDDLPGSIVLPLLRKDKKTDTEVVEHLGAVTVQSLADGADANTVQMRVMARHSCFLAVQGGDQAFAASFGGTHLVLDKTELNHAEPDAFYSGMLPRLAGGSFHRVRSDFAFFDAMDAFLARGCQQCTT